MPRFFFLTLLSLPPLLSTGAGWSQIVPLRPSATTHNAIVRDLGGGVFEVRTTGADPYVVCQRLPQPFDAEHANMLAFEYTSETGLDILEVFWSNPFSPVRYARARNLTPTDRWLPFAIDLQASARDARDWNPDVRDFRLDFGTGGGNVIRLRRLCLRPMTPDEQQAALARLEEQRRRRKELLRRVETHLVAPRRIAAVSDVLAAKHRFESSTGITTVTVFGRDLDLPTQLSVHGAEVSPPVPVGPSLIVGEGEDPQNHTIVRILNRHGICEVQFLAYPPRVRGGVQVCAAVARDGTPAIITAPLQDASTDEVRAFSRWGNQVAQWPVKDIDPPFAITTGDFLSDRPGEEVALVSRDSAHVTEVKFYDLSGQLLVAVPLMLRQAGRVRLSTYRAGGKAYPVVYVSGAQRFIAVDANRVRTETMGCDAPANATGVFQSAFDEPAWVLSVNEPEFSHLVRLDNAGRATRIDVGARENLFWFTTGGKYGAAREGRYVRHANFAHIRTDFGSPHARDPDFDQQSPEYWAGEEYAHAVNRRLQNYDAAPPTCWEPCFTHRWFYSQAQKWAAARDPETGLPMYVLVDRNNKIGAYGEFGRTKSFISGSYAPGLQAVDRFYTYPQRVFLRELARRFRANPEHFVAVEPNHEMEINADSRDTHGDYNPFMIRGFYRYLVSLYGDLAGINQRFGTTFTPDRFDAPRDLGRGRWDACLPDNDYYRAWMRYMNYAVYRIVAATYREALLAGFPPESIKCHQIPDLYAISSLSAFSRPARRITPIDWNLNAGVGFGFTRYGVWFDRPRNCVQGPHSSGFDAMVVGEYQSLTPAADRAYGQLAYMRDHGVQFIHCMVWPKSHDRGFNQALAEALQRFAAEDKPRLAQTGGTGQVRAVQLGERRFDIVSIGVGPQKTGLLKSIDAEGKWEGSVYVVPFHAHVDVQPLDAHSELTLTDKPLRIGPLTDVDSGDLVEISFAARANSPAHLNLRALHRGRELTALRTSLDIDSRSRHYRMLVRIQTAAEELTLELAAGGRRAVAIHDLLATRQTEKTIKLKRGIFEGQRHRGGVTFDVLPARS